MIFNKKILNIIAIVILLLSGQVIATDKAQITNKKNKSVDGFIEQQMSDSGIVGLGAAIIINKKVVWMKGYGFADKTRAVPFTPDTIMNIGSISKTFTGAAMMRAIEQGKLSLDEDINSYLPFKVINPHYPNEKITLRHLATHTSGITDRWSVYTDTYHYQGSTPPPLGEFLRSYFLAGGEYYSQDNFLKSKSGTHRDYSNIAAGLAGYIIEQAVGEKLNNFSKQQIFLPLQMKNTGWQHSEIDPAKHSTLYVAQDGLSIPIQLYEGTTYPDGGVRTSVAELSKFFIALLNEGEFNGTRILEKHSVDEMLRFQFSGSNKPDNVSLDDKNSGLFWATKFNTKRIGHGGSDPGVKTEMLSDRSKQVGIILFTNTSLSDKEKRYYGAISSELWKYAETLKR